jgi:hypothetical protein
LGAARQYRRHSSSDPPRMDPAKRRRQTSTSQSSRREVVERFRLRPVRDRSSGWYGESRWRGRASGKGCEPQSHQDSESLPQVIPAVPDEKLQLRKSPPLCVIESNSSIDPGFQEIAVWKGGPICLADSARTSPMQPRSRGDTNRRLKRSLNGTFVAVERFNLRANAS